MPFGQLRLPHFPFWRTFAAACLLYSGLAGCSDRAEDAQESAAQAQQSLASNDLQAARIAIAEAIASRDDIVDYHLLRGRIELALGSEGSAYDAYSDALALDATNGEALQGVAQLGLATGHLNESQEAAERITTLAPDQPDALLILGIHSLIHRRTEEAIEFANRILKNAPGDGAGTILKARALFISGEASQALEVLDNVANSGADSVGVRLTKLEIYRSLRQPDPLSSEFVQLHRLRSDDLALRLDEANFRFKRGERATAHRLIVQVLADSKTTSDLARAAIDLWWEYGSSDLPEPEIGLIIKEANVSSRRELARYFLDRRDAAHAASVIATLTADIALRARLALLQGRTSEASRLAAAVVEKDQTNCDALIAASEAARLRKQPAEAVRRAQLASAECPLQAYAWITTARAYAANGQESAVRRAFTQALDVNQQSTRLTAAYSAWLQAEGHPRQAVAIGRRLTRYAPGLISGWQLYANLCRQLQPSCIDEALAGLEDARTRFGIDPVPGQPAPNGLFGRFAER